MILKAELLFGKAVSWILAPDKQPWEAQHRLVSMSCYGRLKGALLFFPSCLPLLMVQEILISHLVEAFSPQFINYPKVTQPKCISALFFSTISLVIPPFVSRNSFWEKKKTFLGTCKIFDPNSNNNISSSEKRRVILPQP